MDGWMVGSFVFPMFRKIIRVPREISISWSLLVSFISLAFLLANRYSLDESKTYRTNGSLGFLLFLFLEKLDRCFRTVVVLVDLIGHILLSHCSCLLEYIPLLVGIRLTTSLS